MHKDLSLIIPAFNEAQRLGPTLHRVAEFLASSGLTYEIVVVNDGSSDDTAELARATQAEIPALRLISYPHNRGKGHAVRLGMMAARGRVRVMFDADGATPPEEIPKVFNPVALGQVDIAIGSRYVGGAHVANPQPRWRRAWSRIVNRVVRQSFGFQLADTQCGLKAFSAAAADAVFPWLETAGWAFDIEALALATREGLTIREIAVSWTDDPRSRVSPVRDFCKVVGEWWAIRKRLRRPRRDLPVASPRASLPRAV
ncbi:MAG TPA: dolichyl-phosphate beta-glucosyltransferase [Kofleriaceae bacterium]|nr:dolichyl-phosphate beta-glucosyltransferase [Kofleriaceae bacterium]